MIILVKLYNLHLQRIAEHCSLESSLGTHMQLRGLDKPSFNNRELFGTSEVPTQI